MGALRPNSVVVALGLGWSVLFPIIGLRYQLEMYGDGAMFSYAVAVQDVWAFHWHNISGRLSVYILTLLPAETYVGLTGDATGGIVVYGLLFYAAQLVGLIATFAADRSDGRVYFVTACFSTACLCPLIFGFPSEIWMTHAIFWPALAAAHYARRGIGGTVLIFTLLLALIFTHEAALIFAVAILATLLLRGVRDPAFGRAAGGLLVAMSIWAAVKVIIRPDDYFSGAYVRAALNFFNLAILSNDLVLLLFGALVSYGIGCLVFGRLTPVKRRIAAVTIVAATLATYWLWLDRGLHAADRYYLRTMLVIVTPALGALAALCALCAEQRLAAKIPGMARLMTVLASQMPARAVTGAALLITLVHGAETAKFVSAWTKYRMAVLALATGTASDPGLGDPRFVSSDRIGVDLNRLSWFSTTPFLSAVVANFAPARLVVDPAANYFWLSCETATASLNADRAIPVETRRMVRAYECLHR